MINFTTESTKSAEKTKLNFIYPISDFGRLRSVRRLRQMRELDLFAPCQVGYCARQVQDAMIGSDRQILLRHASTMSPAASNSDLHLATCKIALSPRHAYLRYRRYPTLRRLQIVYFACLWRLARAPDRFACFPKRSPLSFS